MINVPDRPHVHMGLRALKDFLRHEFTSSFFALTTQDLVLRVLPAQSP
jgi:hypothetical protein